MPLGRSAAVLSIAAVLAIPSIAGLFGPHAARRIGEMRGESVTPVEAARAVQGYYEQIAEVPVRAGAWLAMLEGQPIVEQPVHFTDLTHPSDDFLELGTDPELVRNSGPEAPISINRFGMRDRADLTQQKPAGVRRIAMVGSSVVMGYGVADDQTFPRLFETGLNLQRKPDEPLPGPQLRRGKEFCHPSPLPCSIARCSPSIPMSSLLLLTRMNTLGRCSILRN